MLTLVECLGLLAGVLTTFSFVPQVIKIRKTRDVSSISLLMYSAFSMGVFLWVVYGSLIGSIALIVANGVTFMFAATILYLKITIERQQKTSSSANR